MVMMLKVSIINKESIMDEKTLTIEITERTKELEVAKLVTIKKSHIPK